MFLKKDSIIQLIDRSLVWRDEFAKYVKDIESENIGAVRNLKAAKHRHESYAKPRGRFVLYMDAVLTVAELMNAARGEAQQGAKPFLDFVTEEVLIQSAMLADASDEGLLFTRALDAEEVDVAELPRLVSSFVDRLQMLFVEGRCVNVVGYTKYMLDRLKGQPRFARGLANGPKILGGPAWQSAPIVARCLSRMRSYVKLALCVTRAEFPSYDILNAFHIFSLRKVGTSAAVGNPDMSAEMLTMLERLAVFYKLDKEQLTEEFKFLCPYAAHEFNKKADCTNAEAWQAAITKHLPKRIPAMHHVCLRYIVYAISTAGVEQNFSKLKNIFGDQALSGAADCESRVAKLVLDRPLLKQDERERIVGHAQETLPAATTVERARTRARKQHTRAQSHMPTRPTHAHSALKHVPLMRQGGVIRGSRCGVPMFAWMALPRLVVLLPSY